MLPSLARLVPTASPYGRPATGMSDVQLRYTLKKTLKEANALFAKRKHLDQMSEDAAQRYMDYMRSLDGTQKDYKAKMDALQAAWDEAKQRFWEAERAVEDAIQRVIELRQELAQRGLEE
jgi:chromosome segregation ATPase